MYFEGIRKRRNTESVANAVELADWKDGGGGGDSAMGSSMSRLLAALKGTSKPVSALDSTQNEKTPSGPPITYSSADRDYLAFVKHCLFAVASKYDGLWAAVPEGHRSPLHIVFDAAATIVELLRNPDISINEIIESLVKEGMFLSSVRETHLEVAQAFVLATIAASTMVLDSSIFCLSKPTVPSLLIDRADQPFVDTLRAMGVDLSAQEAIWQNGLLNATEFLDPKDTLLASNLNFDSICKLAKLEIVWVYNVSEHLLLDARTMRLSLFALPSFCETLNEETSILESLTSALNKNVGTYEHFTATGLVSEILLSFDLLFYGNRAKTYWKNKLGKDLGGKEGHFFDNMLNRLCARGSDKRRPPRGAYSRRIEFPILASRLDILHTFIENYRPGTGVALWRDRRSLLSWYTLWAVIFLGIIGILLSATQLAFTVAQVVLAYQAL